MIRQNEAALNQLDRLCEKVQAAADELQEIREYHPEIGELEAVIAQLKVKIRTEMAAAGLGEFAWERVKVVERKGVRRVSVKALEALALVKRDPDLLLIIEQGDGTYGVEIQENQSLRRVK